MKRAVNLWLSEEEYAWLKVYATKTSQSMTSVLRKLVQTEKEKDEQREKPEQF